MRHFLISKMEFSLAQSLQGHTELAHVPFPHLKSDPASDQVNPGLGQIVNLFDTIVPMRGHVLHKIEKKLEDTLPVLVVEDKSQTGFGNSTVDPEILTSFMHPIVTDSIIFPQTEKSEKTPKATKQKSTNSKDESEPKAKKPKINHKFNVVH